MGKTQIVNLEKSQDVDETRNHYPPRGH